MSATSFGQRSRRCSPQRRRLNKSCSRPRPAPAASSTAPGPPTKTGNACRSLPISARAFPPSISPPSAFAWEDALYRQEYFGAFVSAPGSVFDAEVLAHMFGDHTEEEPEEPAIIVQGRIADRFLQ